MNALDLLLEASARQEPLATFTHSEPASGVHKASSNTHGDALEAIMLLAGQASRLQVPSPIYRTPTAYETVHGLVYRHAAPKEEQGDVQATRSLGPRRPRALSEPWSLAEFSHLHSLHAAADHTAVPDFVAKYADIINKNGRIGIYTKEERVAIVARFREKKKRRVWQKKIRYTCRKSLADRRLRVKGRFVKMAPNATGEGEGGGEELKIGGEDHRLRFLASLLDMPEEGEEDLDGDEEEEEEEHSNSYPRTSSTNTTAASDIAHGHDTRRKKRVSIKEESNKGTSKSKEEAEQPYKRVRRHSIAY